MNRKISMERNTPAYYTTANESTHSGEGISNERSVTKAAFNSSEQVISHEERMRRHFRRNTHQGFVFQTFKDPCSNAHFHLLHRVNI